MACGEEVGRHQEKGQDQSCCILKPLRLFLLKPLRLLSADSSLELLDAPPQPPLSGLLHPPKQECTKATGERLIHCELGLVSVGLPLPKSPFSAGLPGPGEELQHCLPCHSLKLPFRGGRELAAQPYLATAQQTIGEVSSLSLLIWQMGVLHLRFLH